MRRKNKINGAIAASLVCTRAFGLNETHVWAARFLLNRRPKTQNSSVEEDFLGLIHDVSMAEKLGAVYFCPRKALSEKISGIISIATEVGLPSGTASKLYGISNFTETGMYARIGRAGLRAIKDRQKEVTFEITPARSKSFELLSDLFKLMPRREYMLWNLTRRRTVTASDAAYEDGKGSAGFLSVIDPGRPEETRLGRAITLPANIYSIWGDRKITYIAQLELLAMLVALQHRCNTAQ